MCENCGQAVSVDDTQQHANQCNGGSSQQTLDVYFSESALQPSSDSNNVHTQMALQAMFPASAESRISAVLATSTDIDEAVERLSGDAETSIPKCGEDLLKEFRGKCLRTEASLQHLTVRRDHIWRNGVLFYKLAFGKKEMLEKPLSVEFVNEEGVDGGALKREFFSKFFEVIRKDMFEEAPNGDLIPKRSGGNLQLFKIVGMAIGHSILQEGPVFPGLAPWCYALIAGKVDDEIIALISRQSFKDSIPLNAGTNNLLSLLNALESVSSKEEIDQLLENSADSPAYEQIINSSQWPIDCVLSMSSVETLKSMLIWEELVDRREKQIKSVREGLDFVGFLPFLQMYPEMISPYFEMKMLEMSASVMMSIISWDGVSDHKKEIDWLKEYVMESDSTHLIMLLKFATGLGSVNVINMPTIHLGYTTEDKILPESIACANTFLVPLGNSTKDEFFRSVTTALELGFEGYGNL